MRKKMTVLLTVMMTLAMSVTAFAYGWGTDETGEWYYNNKENTEWYSDGWYWVPFDEGGSAYCYYFDADGYIVKDTIIDNYTVNPDGIWTINDIPQVMSVSIPADYYDTPESATGLSNSSLAGDYYEYSERLQRYRNAYQKVTVVDEDTLIIQYYTTTIHGEEWVTESPDTVTKSSDNVYCTTNGQYTRREYIFTSDDTLELYEVFRYGNGSDAYERRFLYSTYYKKAD